ncbi:MAG: aldehyde dehydrogenase family protein, partial [Sphingobacteriales bacterium]
MLKGFFNVPTPVNEPILNYGPGSKERVLLKEALAEARSHQQDIPMYIGGKQVHTAKKGKVVPPHDHQHILAQYSIGDKTHIQQAIDAALAAKEDWENLPWEHRAAIFLKAADLIAGKYRYKLNAATMLGQSKNAYQAEIDAACELIDFLRFNVSYMSDIYKQQPPVSPRGSWNRVEQRPLEGFVFALTPFNFTAIAANLPASAAMMGNVVVWKPADTQVYAANLLMEIFREAGLPDGVVNLVYADGPETGDVIFNHSDFAGIHFTGSTKVFQEIWKTIGTNIHKYKSYPRIVGETGGKDFILVHPSAQTDISSTAIVRGAFEYQGQK